MQAGKPPKMTAQLMELLVASHFGTRENIIVPNVSWGLINHEADVLVLRPSGWIEEVEIKVSKSDIKRDLQKNDGGGHRHSQLIHKLWFAVPVHLADTPEIPADAGILTATYTFGWGSPWSLGVLRAPKCYKRARKATPDEVYKLMRLGMFRIWTLKDKLYKIRKSQEEQNGMARITPEA